MFAVTTLTFDQLYGLGLSLREKQAIGSGFADREYDDRARPAPVRIRRSGDDRAVWRERRRRAMIL